MKILITRSEPGASQTADRVRKRGAEPVIAPLLRIAFAEDVEIELGRTNALLFTSPNGVRAWLSARSETDLPAFCVGDATAAAAEEAGFRKVRSAGGDAADLIALCEARLIAGRHRLLHARGKHVACDIAAALQARGFDVDEAVIYDAVAAEKLPGIAAALIRQRQLAVVLFHSPRAAIAFTALVEDADLSDYLNTVIAITISDATANGLVRSDWAAVKVAEAPNEIDMLSRIGFDG
jgi:uroporphyrinogen-III synthase